MLPYSFDTHKDIPLGRTRDRNVFPDGASAVDACAVTVDLQMLMVSEQENTYWQMQFAQEPYYVAGRGYDQYKPAYELGWSTALQHPDAGFVDFAQALEMQWSAQTTSSLLPWREVHQAVKDAWVHASAQMQKMQSILPTVLPDKEVVTVLHPLLQACQTLLRDVLNMRSESMNDFAQQVIERHVHLLQRFVQVLSAFCSSAGASLRTVTQWPQRLHVRWMQFRSSLSEWAPAEVFEVCEQRERRLLFAYQRALRKNLPIEVKSLLEQQAKTLELNLEKLSWVRHNWSLQTLG